MDTKTLTPEELQSVKKIHEENNILISQFGILEMEIQNLEQQKKTLIEKLNQHNKSSEKIGDELQVKYGVGNVNLDTGEFISQ